MRKSLLEESLQGHKKPNIFLKNSNNSGCNTSVGGLSSDEEDDFDCQLENNDNLEDLR